jgi:uncharacterized membrane protein
MGWTTRLRSGSLDAHRLDANGQVCYKYIYVGPLERSHYPSAALDKFDYIMDVVYQQGAVTIYKRR